MAAMSFVIRPNQVNLCSPPGLVIGVKLSFFSFIILSLLCFIILSLLCFIILSLFSFIILDTFLACFMGHLAYPPGTALLPTKPQLLVRENCILARKVAISIDEYSTAVPFIINEEKCEYESTYCSCERKNEQLRDKAYYIHEESTGKIFAWVSGCSCNKTNKL